MLAIVIRILNVFVIIVTLTSLMVVGALGYLWFIAPPGVELPYLGYLITSLIVEIIGVVIVLAKKGVKYLPGVETHKTPADTMRFMSNFVTSGSTVQIVSSRVAWMRDSTEFIERISTAAKDGALIEIITPLEVITDIRAPLLSVGVKFFATGEDRSPEARFTLINGNRSGAERLAIAKGSHPEHEVTIFDNTSGPQIIGMAKDIIRKSKELANARALGSRSVDSEEAN